MKVSIATSRVLGRKPRDPNDSNTNSTAASTTASAANSRSVSRSNSMLVTEGDEDEDDSISEKPIKTFKKTLSRASSRSQL